ncbi:MAG: GIY-YIG nuclease family protein [Firmicutes bacterium]|nr:GIY-YIG nuclease family protein [Bacillota bacterium]
MDRRKELKAWYKQMKPEMGVFMILSPTKDKCYLEGTQDLKGTLNSTKFKLNFGNHPNKELQQDWKKYGEVRFTIRVLETLQYDKDETKTDYSEELAILKYLWEEKLQKKGLTFYNARGV